MRHNNFILEVLASAILIGLMSFAPRAMATEDKDARSEDWERRISELEAKDTINLIKWSGTLINRYDYLQNKNTDTGKSDYLDTFSVYVDLNADAKLNEKVSVHISLDMSKFWNNDGRSEKFSSWTGSETGGYGLGGSTPSVDRAYMTYKFNRVYTLALGRMSTNMGPPIEQLDGVAREGTYPRFAYNAIFDGAAFIIDASQLVPKNQSLKFRLFYTPFINVSPYSRSLQATDSDGEKISSNTPQYTLLAEYEINHTMLANKFTLMYFYYNYYNFYDSGENFDPTTGQGGYYSETADTEEAHANMGFLSLEGIASTGLNLSGSLLYVVYKSTIDGKWTTSNAYLLNANYQFGSLGNLIAGGEYVHTDTNFYLDEWTYLNLVPFYNSPKAQGEHLFITKPLGDGLTLRVGYYNLTAKADPDAGLAYQNNVEMKSYYANLRLDF